MLQSRPSLRLENSIKQESNSEGLVGPRLFCLQYLGFSGLLIPSCLSSLLRRLSLCPHECQTLAAGRRGEHILGSVSNLDRVRLSCLGADMR